MVFSRDVMLLSAGILGVLTLILVQLWMRACPRWITHRDWWPRARKLQKKMMVNGGTAEDLCTDERLAGTYCWVLFVCIHHAIAGCCMFPVVLSGWEGAGLLGQQFFGVGGLLTVGFDIEDIFTTLATYFFPVAFSVLGAPTNLMGVTFTCFHHALSISMFLPFLLLYPDLKSFHHICCSLLLAAGVAYGFGSYKFTLDTRQRGQFIQYKAIVVVQFLTIWFTRCYVWFTSAADVIHNLNVDPRQQDDRTMYYAGICVIITMSIFNVAMLIDCTMAAIKWIPRRAPSNDSESNEIEEDTAASAMVSRGMADQLQQLGKSFTSAGRRASMGEKEKELTKVDATN